MSFHYIYVCFLIDTYTNALVPIMNNLPVRGDYKILMSSVGIRTFNYFIQLFTMEVFEKQQRIPPLRSCVFFCQSHSCTAFEFSKNFVHFESKTEFVIKQFPLQNFSQNVQKLNQNLTSPLNHPLHAAQRHEQRRGCIRIDSSIVPKPIDFDNIFYQIIQ